MAPLPPSRKKKNHPSSSILSSVFNKYPAVGEKERERDQKNQRGITYNTRAVKVVVSKVKVNRKK